MMHKLTYKAQLSQNRQLTGAATPCLPTIPAEGKLQTSLFVEKLPARQTTLYMWAGALQVSLAMSCHVYPDIMLGVYSKAATCVRQTMYTADRIIPASQLFALPCLHVILAACLIN
jgi:hypothetical protein